ncbi:MAG: electron transport complex subunit E [Bacteriovoracaceae bacterium]|nr:electron transport complex subunit E [Bacteriovoracaceae bacterium]
MSNWKTFTKGLFKDNPVFVMLLGMCPVLGVTTSAMNGLGMGLATTFVLTLSNVVISLIKNLIPDKVRIPAFIVVIASFVTIVDLCMAGYLPGLHSQLGLFIPLIVVNCIVLGRAESFASKNKTIPALFDGLGMGLGFTIALVALGGVREILGSGSIFDFKFVSDNASTLLIFVMPPGAFIALGYIIAITNKLNKKA